MADEVTSGEIRTRQFDLVRKGYDRNQVESFLAKVAGQIDTLVERIAEAPDTDLSVGIDDAEARAREWEAIGGEIDKILGAARSAAEGMRTRASAHAKTWVSEADSQAYAARESAWNEGSGMLAAAIEEARMIVAEAETEALRIRAEAEREAIRYTADAKRAGEEAIGVAENEAEGILASSRAESERVLRAANQSADLAKERARALEDHRAELLVELESTRSSIGDLETEMESKRQELEEPEPAVVAEYEEPTHHRPDGGSVRIVSASKVVPLRPVDADSFVAEVAEMRRTAEMEQLPIVSSQSSADSRQPDEEGAEGSEQVGRQPAEDARYQTPGARYQRPDTRGQTPDTRRQTADTRGQTPDMGQVSDAEPRPEEVEQQDAQPEEQLVVADAPLPQLAGGDVEQDSQQPTAASSQPEEESSQFTVDSSPSEGEQPSAEPVPEPEAAVDPIGSLFAQLRQDGKADTRSQIPDDREQDSRQPTPDSRQPEGEGESRQPSADSRQPEEEGAEDSGQDSGEWSAESSSLIPVQNAALRTIKRTLVDLQNDALEHLRTDTAWVPEEEFTDRFSEPFTELATAVTGDDDDGGAASVFATDLYDAVSSAVVAAREAGSGDRAVAAETSKVFRTWRSDEAERRVVAAASTLSERA